MTIFVFKLKRCFSAFAKLLITNEECCRRRRRRWWRQRRRYRQRRWRRRRHRWWQWSHLSELQRNFPNFFCNEEFLDIRMQWKIGKKFGFQGKFSLEENWGEMTKKTFNGQDRKGHCLKEAAVRLGHNRGLIFVRAYMLIDGRKMMQWPEKDAASWCLVLQVFL